MENPVPLPDLETSIISTTSNQTPGSFSHVVKQGFLTSYIHSTGLSYWLASPQEILQALQDGQSIAAVQAPDKFSIRLRMRMPAVWQSRPLQSFLRSSPIDWDRKKRVVQVADPDDPAIGWSDLPIGKAQFSFVKVRREGKDVAIYLNFNPTVDILTPHLRHLYRKHYRVPKLTGYGKTKANHFHPLYLSLPENFVFQNAIMQRFRVYETACDSIEKGISKILGQKVQLRREIITAEHYKDFITNDPVMTFGQLAVQIGRGLGANLLTKGFNNARSFLSLYAWDGPEKEASQFNYIGLSAFPKVQADEDYGVIIRAEVRRMPNRKKHANSRLEIPHPCPLASHEHINMSWILKDWLVRITSTLGQKKSAALLADGFVRLASTKKAELDAILNTPGMGQVLALKVQKRKAKNGSTSFAYTLNVTTDFRLQLALAAIFSDLLEGQYSDQRLAQLMDNEKSAPEYLHRRLRGFVRRKRSDS